MTGSLSPAAEQPSQIPELGYPFNVQTEPQEQPTKTDAQLAQGLAADLASYINELPPGDRDPRFKAFAADAMRLANRLGSKANTKIAESPVTHNQTK